MRIGVRSVARDMKWEGRSPSNYTETRFYPQSSQCARNRTPEPLQRAREQAATPLLREEGEAVRRREDVSAASVGPLAHR